MLPFANLQFAVDLAASVFMSLGFVGQIGAAVQMAPELFSDRLLHSCRSSEVTTVRRICEAKSRLRRR
jgi:dihydrodipicolinate synthase/N-acetylneuraminate lyase